MADSRSFQSNLHRIITFFLKLAPISWYKSHDWRDTALMRSQFNYKIRIDGGKSLLLLGLWLY
ncbi:hypothetical protein FD723_23275 [Nostoc sp. C052]|uniref:hypothetical protein n=1 Tax=Nostoc sp. C052 TaxID=2576902 RepID=UPI0015C31C95|nr:hypothetical protein [Nostoc sp. C052]QLE43078.1 hypothetical protein FD723_23275 [Nostoc sp. C052]